MPYVRDGRPGEAAALTAPALRSTAHRGYGEALMEACREELAVRPQDVPARRTAVAERGGGVLGFTVLDGEPPRGALGTMFVEPDTIGGGVGRLLPEHTAERARRPGFVVLHRRRGPGRRAPARGDGRGARRDGPLGVRPRPSAAVDGTRPHLTAGGV